MTWNKLKLYGNVQEVHTPAEMREEILRLRNFDPIIHHIFRAAEMEGMSEDKYLILAYHLLRVRESLMEDRVREALLNPSSMIVKKGEG